MVVTLAFLYVSSERASILHNQSGTAYAAAYSGIEVAKHQFVAGTACGSLTNTNQQVGSGQFTTTPGNSYPTAFAATLTSNIPAGSVSSIPLSFTSGNLSYLAPHGEITIGTESIDYGSTSAAGSACSPAPCLGGIVRGANGTTAAAHTAGAAVTQASQCLITSTGTAGSATRKLESTVQASASGVSNSFTSSGLTTLTTTPATTSLTGGWAPGLPAGDNYVFAIVTFSNTTVDTTIPAGNLKLVAANPPAPAAPLQSTTSPIDVGGSATAGPNDFPQETQFLMGKHAGALTTATYDVTVDSPSNANTVARVQILAISGIASANASLFPGGLQTGLSTISPGTTLVTSGPITAGNNIIIAQVQLDSSASPTRDITTLALNKGGSALMSNTFSITLSNTNKVNRGTGALLVAIDPNAAAGATYTVTALASGANTNGSASILVFNGFNAAVQSANPPASIPFGSGPGTSLVSVPTTFPVGENVVFAAIQYWNNGGANRNITAGNETITLNGTSVSSPTTSANAYNWNLCSGAGAGNACDDFYSGLLWRQTAATATANPAFGVQSQADVNPTMTGAANVLAISLTGGVRRINTIEVYPP
jgi:hypothetical protein